MEKVSEKEKKSRVLIIGATGNLGFELAKASLQSSHPTFALVRNFDSDSSKSHKLQFLSNAGITLLKVCVYICMYFCFLENVLCGVLLILNLILML